MKISTKTQNVLTETERTFRRVPKEYRKEVYDFLATKLKNPKDRSFRHDQDIVIHAFHRVYTLYNTLCDDDKLVFNQNFSDLASKLTA